MASIFNWLFGNGEETYSRKRIFISFAMEDEIYRDYLKDQARNNRSPFDFIDMSIKTPYKQSEWKKKCRAKIKRCHGVIVLVSRHTYLSSGARFEIKCAKEERIPLIGIYVKKSDKGVISFPPELKGVKTDIWTWDNIETFINKI